MTRDDKNRLRAAKTRTSRARSLLAGKYVVTCPASRHLHIIADALAAGRPYPMLEEEPQHCAETMYAVLACLWTLRSKSPDYAKQIDRAIARIETRGRKSVTPHPNSDRT